MIDLPPSAALSILADPPATFAGRTLGLVVTDDAPAAIVEAIRRRVTAAGGAIVVIAPKIAGVRLDDGTELPAHQFIDGAPSVLYDAVALIVSPAGADRTRRPTLRRGTSSATPTPTASSSVTVPDAAPLLAAAGVADLMDGGYVAVANASAARAFVDRIAELRFWERDSPFTAAYPG